MLKTFEYYDPQPRVSQFPPDQLPHKYQYHTKFNSIYTACSFPLLPNKTVFETHCLSKLIEGWNRTDRLLDGLM